MSDIRHLVPAACVAIALTSAGPALAAGGPYAVDDAEIVERGACELDGWHARGDRDNHETVAVGSCQFVPGVQLGISATFGREAGESAESFGIEGKTVFRETSPSGIGVGLVAGADYGRQSDRIDTVHAFVPLSFDPIETVRLNLNVGWEWDREDRRHFATWGAGATWAALPRFALIGEVFGRDRGRAAAQLGVRPEIIEGTFHLDLVYGRNLTDEARDWVTIGGTLAF